MNASHFCLFSAKFEHVFDFPLWATSARFVTFVTSEESESGEKSHVRAVYPIFPLQRIDASAHKGKLVRAPGKKLPTASTTLSERFVG